MGVRLLRSKATPLDLRADPVCQVDLWRIYRRGFLTNVLNPKVALFFLAFVPQFIATGTDNKALAFLLLGVIFNLNSLPINFGYAWLAAWAARRVHTVQRAMHWLDHAAGVLFLGFGLRLALSDNPTR